MIPPFQNYETFKKRVNFQLGAIIFKFEFDFSHMLHNFATGCLTTDYQITCIQKVVMQRSFNHRTTDHFGHWYKGNQGVG